jgi:hypothetical protein
MLLERLAQVLLKWWWLIVASVLAVSIPTFLSTRTLLNVAIAAAIGLALAVGAALLLELIDDSLKTSDDVRRVLNLTSWGNIPRIKGHDHFDRLVMIQSPRSPAAQAFRMLRTNLQSSVRARPLRTLLLTSPGPEEGKSLIAANLAVTLAQSGKRVILVDADLRRPTHTPGTIMPLCVRPYRSQNCRTPTVRPAPCVARCTGHPTLPPGATLSGFGSLGVTVSPVSVDHPN